MPNGVDFARGRVPEEDVRAVCRDFDLPEGVPVFLFVGRMMWYKGLRITLDALKKLKDAGHPFRMVFVGSGGDKDEVVAYANELGLSDCVFFTSPQYDRSVIRAWYCRGDLFLFPSTFDTNGLVVREAAACELASVLVRGSCAAEDITDGRNGFLIEENADSMAALLAKLCHEPEVLKRVGRQAQEEIYISWDDAVHRAQQRYEIVIEQYRSGGHSARRRFSDEYSPVAWPVRRRARNAAASTCVSNGTLSRSTFSNDMQNAGGRSFGGLRRFYALIQFFSFHARSFRNSSCSKPSTVVSFVMWTNSISIILAQSRSCSAVTS